MVMGEDRCSIGVSLNPSTKYSMYIFHIIFDLFETTENKRKEANDKCDQIGRFIALWATFQSLRQQLFCPKM